MDTTGDSDDSRTASADLPPSVVLLNAAELLETRGWCQSTYYNDNGACCLVGAIGAVVLGRDDTSLDLCRVEMSHPAMALVRKVTDEIPSFWNDRPGRTRAQVISRLREAAALAAAEGR